MKNQTTFSVAVAAALIGATGSAAAADTQLYGQVRLTANQVRNGNGATVLELRDNASRAGLRGSEDLGGGLQALYGVEAGLNADDGTLTSPALRNAYVGLGGSWGKLALGRLDSANPTGSPLYSQAVAIVTFAANDAGATAIGTSILNARNRTSNAVGYLSPEWGGVAVTGRYYLRGAGTSAETEDAARSIDLGVNYGNGPLRLAFGYGKDSRMGGLKAKEFDWKWQAGARYSLGLVEPYVLLGADHFVPTATTRGRVGFALVGAALRFDPHAVVFNVMERQVQTSPNGTRKREQLAYLYRLSKRTELQAFIDNDNTDSSKSGVTIRAIGLGMRHDF